MATRTGYKITVYLDDNPLSPTYMQTYEEKVLDEETCPIPTDDLVLVSNECEITLSGYSGYRIATYYNTTTGEYTTEKVEDPDCTASSTDEQWVNSGSPYCEVSDKGVNTGYMLQPQVQSNINLENYGATRVNRYKSPDCGSNGCAIWDDIQKQCHMLVTDCNIRFDGTSDVSQIDINPLSPTYNQTRTINRQDDDCVNCTQTVFNWVDLGTMCGNNEVLCNNGIQEVSINSYTVSQKYKTIGSGVPIPMDEYQVTLNLENDEDCGYIPPQYRWDVVQGQYICDEETYTKYQTLMHMVSYDRGVTWSAVDPIETKRGEVLAYDSYECGKPMERWVENGETVCEDNGDDWKLKVVGASSTAIAPCDETEVLTNGELPSIPEGVTSVDFGNCITRIECHMSVSFGSSDNPATVHFGDYVEVIGHAKFGGILNGYLKYDEDSFDDNLRIINKNAFLSGNNTYSNNTAYLGSKIETIGDMAFYNRKANLNTLKIGTVTPPSIGTDALYHYDMATSDYKANALNCILVPRGSVDSYKNAWTDYSQYIYSLAEEDTFYRATYSDGTRGWNFSSEGTGGMLSERMVFASYGGRFKSSITDVYLSNEVTSIGRSAFADCTSLTSVTIPNSVTRISYSAFRVCSGLTSITIPNSVTYIGEWAFATCWSLTNITIPSSVTRIDDYAFQGCSGLTSFTIENGEIGSEVFWRCRGLKRIDIGSGVTKIEDMAFFDIITHDGKDDNYCPPESDIVVYCYATTPPKVRFGQSAGAYVRNSPFVYSGTTSTGQSKGYLYKPVVYVPCSSMVAYKASKWNDICVLKPINDDCAETRWVVLGYVCLNGERHTNEGKEIRYPSGEWEDTGERRVGTSSLGSCPNVDLNNQWQSSTSYGNISDIENYDFYESFSNHNTIGGAATMFIKIKGYTSFTFKVRNYSEADEDFVVVNNLDDTSILLPWPLYPDVGSGTAERGYVYYSNKNKSSKTTWYDVTFDNLDGGEHIITVTYGKDETGSEYDDRGYVAIPIPNKNK